MSRPNLARLEPSAYTVLSVADPEQVATRTEQVLGDLDLDHLCRLLIRSERSLSLVNRRSFAAALADVPALPNQALRPAPPFSEAVASAREDGKLLERTRRFLAQNPRALEELTPELTLALLRHFDPTMRMRTSPFTRHVVAVGSVTVIALVAAVLGIVHTQQNDALTAKATDAQIAQIEREQHVAAGRESAPRRPEPVRAIPTAAPVFRQPAPLIVVPPLAAPRYLPPTVAVAPHTETATVLPIVQPHRPHQQLAAAPVPAAVAAKPSTTSKFTSLFVPPAPVASSSKAAAPIAPPSAEPTVAATAPPVSNATTPEPGAAATALVLRNIVAENPTASVEWIRASKSSDHVVTVTTRIHTGATVSEETYRLYNSDGALTIINHHISTP